MTWTAAAMAGMLAGSAAMGLRICTWWMHGHDYTRPAALRLYDLSKSATCIGLSTRGRVALSAAADALDRALQAAAAAAHAIWADIRGQFARHKICGPDSWLHAADLFALSSSYHPTASGQGLGYLPVFARFAPAPSPRPAQKQKGVTL